MAMSGVVTESDAAAARLLRKDVLEAVRAGDDLATFRGYFSERPGEAFLHAVIAAAPTTGVAVAADRIAYLLTACGVDVDARDEAGLSAVDLAADRRCYRLLTLLVAHGAAGSAHTAHLASLAAQLGAVPPALLGPSQQAALRAVRDLASRNAHLAWQLALAQVLPATQQTGDGGDAGFSIDCSRIGQRWVLPELAGRLIVDGDAGGSSGGQAVGGAAEAGAASVFGKPMQFRPPSQPTPGRSPARVAGRGDTAALAFQPHPPWPGVQQAVGLLARRLFGPCGGGSTPLVPHVELARWPAQASGRVRPTTPVLVSQVIPGDTLLEALLGSPEALDVLDPRRTSELLALTMLVSPEAATPHKFRLAPVAGDRLEMVWMQPDGAFVPSSPTSRRAGELYLAKNVLFCLEQMKHPLHPAVRQAILAIDSPAELLSSWAAELDLVNAEHAALFAAEAADLAKKGTVVGVPLPRGAMSGLCDRLYRMRQRLARDDAVTHRALLQAVDPALAARYLPLLAKERAVGDRFLAADAPQLRREVIGTASWYRSRSSGMELYGAHDSGCREDALPAVLAGETRGPLEAWAEVEAFRREAEMVSTPQALATLHRAIGKCGVWLDPRPVLRMSIPPRPVWGTSLTSQTRRPARLLPRSAAYAGCHPTRTQRKIPRRPCRCGLRA